MQNPPEPLSKPGTRARLTPWLHWCISHKRDTIFLHHMQLSTQGVDRDAVLPSDPLTSAQKGQLRIGHSLRLPSALLTLTLMLLV